MSIDKAKHIMQILWPLKDKSGIVSFKEFRKAVYIAVGTHPDTIKRYIRVLKDLGWIKRINREQFRLIDDFIIDEMF